MALSIYRPQLVSVSGFNPILHDSNEKETNLIGSWLQIHNKNGNSDLFESVLTM